jgi:hypothetical protein
MMMTMMMMMMMTMTTPFCVCSYCHAIHQKKVVLRLVGSRRHAHPAFAACFNKRATRIDCCGWINQKQRVPDRLLAFATKKHLLNLGCRSIYNRSSWDQKQARLAKDLEVNVTMMIITTGARNGTAASRATLIWKMRHISCGTIQC